MKRTPAFIEQGAAVARSILREFSADPVSTAAIEAYFGRLYSLQDGPRAFDAKEIVACLIRARVLISRRRQKGSKLSKMTWWRSSSHITTRPISWSKN